VYQVEYSRNLLFRSGGQMEQVFQGLIDRTRARLTVRDLKTIFGAKRRPFRHKAAPPPRMAVVLETPVYDLTVFKLHFGQLTLKAYTKGEHVLRFEAIVHNTKALGCGRVVAKFPPPSSHASAAWSRGSLPHCTRWIMPLSLMMTPWSACPPPLSWATPGSAGLISTSRACVSSSRPCLPWHPHLRGSAWRTSPLRSAH